MSGYYVHGTPYTPSRPSYLDTGADATPPAPRPQISTATATYRAGLGLVAVISFGGRAAVVRRMTVSADARGRCMAYIGPPIPENLTSITWAGDADENDPATPYYVPEGYELSFVWPDTPGTAGARARVEWIEG